MDRSSVHTGFIFIMSVIDDSGDKKQKEEKK